MNRAILIPVLIFVCFFLVLFFVMPDYVEQRHLGAQLEEKQQELIKKQNYYFETKETLKELQHYQSSVEVVNAALPEEMSLASLLSLFQDSAFESGLILKAVNRSKPTASKEEKNYSETLFNLTLEGSVESTEVFLEKLENSSRIIDLANISIKPREGGSAEAILTLKAYHY